MKCIRRSPRWCSWAISIPGGSSQITEKVSEENPPYKITHVCFVVHWLVTHVALSENFEEKPVRSTGLSWSIPRFLCLPRWETHRWGDKPQEFLNLVPRGLLPAMELDGDSTGMDCLRLRTEWRTTQWEHMDTGYLTVTWYILVLHPSHGSYGLVRPS
jgi:hypothetical protein